MESKDYVRRPAAHKKSETATNRPEYRNTRKRDTAVKVYTINQESRFLVVQKVPALGCAKELVTLFSLYGPIEEYRILDDYPDAEEFFDVYWIKFQNIANARQAKLKCNNYYFLGTEIHVSYASEYESVEDTRAKFEDRRRDILSRMNRRKRQPNEKRGGEQVAAVIPPPPIPAGMLPYPVPPNYASYGGYPSMTPYEQERYSQLQPPHPSTTEPEPSRKRKEHEQTHPSGPAKPPKPSSSSSTPHHTTAPQQPPQDPKARGLNPSVNKTILSIRNKLSGLANDSSASQRTSVPRHSAARHFPSSSPTPPPTPAPTSTLTPTATLLPATPTTAPPPTKPSVKRRRI